ncbi:MAG: hypothetical protein A2X28_03010 [Elusimicrobia bacterium GWA2_56_46]|nr:MAG: hypothetical protein A2X28_03010 [Elusimicrobia bacterium GWA2_56_46]OGR54198.1 MAG: hypothetical protein A2X39_08955 [Elusimicrobia bacterium GWC2_56_31]HBB68266.1 hypothetical protein [Elusimicrobiota bacterium]HBW21776.1 hypothetical protein [Elusimicrobiota bacterium]
MFKAGKTRGSKTPDGIKISGRVKLDLAVLNARLPALPPGAPRYLFLGLTSRCDLACPHCKYSGADVPARKADMPAGLLERVLGEAAGAGIPRVVFFGGEPLLYRGLENAVSAAARLGLFTELDTNGQSLDNARAARLASAGLCAVRISLHSSSPARHNALSGKGTFGKALSAIAAAKRAGLLTYISSCIFSGGLAAGEPEKLAFFAGQHGVHGLRFLAYSPRSGVSPLPLRLSARLARLAPDGYARTCVPPGKKKCAALRGELLYADPGGTVKTCPYSSSTLGSLLKNDLKSILRGARFGRAAGRGFPCQKSG